MEGMTWARVWKRGYRLCLWNGQESQLALQVGCSGRCEEMVHLDHRDLEYFVLKVVRISEWEGDSRGGNPSQRNHSESFHRGNFKEGRTVYKGVQFLYCGENNAHLASTLHFISFKSKASWAIRVHSNNSVVGWMVASPNNMSHPNSRNLWMRPYLG